MNFLGGGGVGGGWLDSLKEKSKELVEVYKRDIAEFSSVVKTEGSQAAERAKGTIEATTTGMLKDAKDFGTSIAAEATPLLAPALPSRLGALQGTASTYTSDPSDAAAYAAFLETFNAQEYTGKVEALLRDVKAVAGMHETLVPEKVPYKQFWARYFYKAGKLEQEEERKKKASKVEQEEERKKKA
ncbi:hypothetical protein T484DRAFT_1921390 [Baffinella frigidus]|nr:hypothetical protein T484DRAFT_1921390 [Cryptophyta sp. CCMP2293]